MRNRIISGLAVAGVVLGAGVATTGTASAATAGSYCGSTYTSYEGTLHPNDTGNAVKALQCELNESVYSSHLTVDGVFGQATLNMVTTFQHCTGLLQDGVVGPNTWAALDRWSAPGAQWHC